MDHAWHVEGVMYLVTVLVIVDGYSKWVELESMHSTTTEKALDMMRMLFAHYGLPKQLLSDKWPQFASTAFASSLEKCSISPGNQWGCR